MRIIFAWLFLFVFLPYLAQTFMELRIVLGNVSLKLLDHIFINMASMISLMVLISYILIALKLYEVISIVALLIVFFMVLSWYYYGSREKMKAAHDQRVAYLLDILEGNVQVQVMLQERFNERLSRLRDRTVKFNRQGKFWIPLGLIAVLTAAAVIRIWDPIHHMAPAMSDAYVTMAWIKYIDWRMLFHDGLYTHGFHIFLSLVHKFSGINVLYLINMVGPLCGVMIVLSIYYAGWRFTQTHAGGLIPAAIYALFLPYLTSDSMRQTATNSQEFALIWMLPALVWAWEYLRSGRRLWLAASMLGVLLIVFIHPMVSFFTVIGLAALSISSWKGVPWRDYLLHFRNLTLGIGLAGVVGAMPLFIGWLLGKNAHGASMEFAVATMIDAMPRLDIFNQHLIAAAVCGILLAMLFKKFRRGQNGAPLMTLMLLVSALALYFGPYWGLKSTSLMTRSGEYLAIILCLSCAWVAAAWEEVWNKLNNFIKHRKNRTEGTGAYDVLRRHQGITALLLLFLLLPLGFRYFPPQILQPYRLQYDSVVKACLQISYDYRPTEWMVIVPLEMYAMILAVGWHLPTSDFLQKDYSIKNGRLYDGNNPNEIQDLFVIVEKVPFHCPEEIDSLQESYRKRAENEKKMLALMTEPGARINQAIYYEDREVVIYHYNNPPDPRKRFNQLWGIE